MVWRIAALLLLLMAITSCKDRHLIPITLVSELKISDCNSRDARLQVGRMVWLDNGYNMTIAMTVIEEVDFEFASEDRSSLMGECSAYAELYLPTSDRPDRMKIRLSDGSTSDFFTQEQVNESGINHRFQEPTAID